MYASNAERLGSDTPVLQPGAAYRMRVTLPRARNQLPQAQHIRFLYVAQGVEAAVAAGIGDSSVPAAVSFGTQRSEQFQRAVEGADASSSDADLVKTPHKHSRRHGRRHKHRSRHDNAATNRRYSGDAAAPTPRKSPARQRQRRASTGDTGSGGGSPRLGGAALASPVPDNASISPMSTPSPRPGVPALT